MTFYRKFKKFSVKQILALDTAFPAHSGGSHSYGNGFVDQVLAYCLSACHLTSDGGLEMNICLKQGPYIGFISFFFLHKGVGKLWPVGQIDSLPIFIWSVS